jgi:glucose/arabinose dehydrogenase
MVMMLRRTFLVFGVCGIALRLHSADVPSGFAVSTIAIPGVTNITDIEWAPDNSQRLFIACQLGQVRIVKESVLLPQLFLSITPFYERGETGLLSMSFDPDFLSNGYVYFCVTTGPYEQRIVRYQAIGDVGMNRFDLVSGLPSQWSFHNGGGLGIGPDGRIYWGIGDCCVGGILRFNLDGTLPALNPFRTTSSGMGRQDQLWAVGFRNPFRLCFQPETGSLWVNVAGANYEQIFLVNRAENAGGAGYENNQPTGYITPRIKYRTGRAETNGLASINGAVRSNNLATFTTLTSAHGFRKGEKIIITDVADPSFNGADYVYSVPTPKTFTFRQTGPDASSGGGTATTLHIGNVVTGGTFYNSTAFPPEYHGNYFFCDPGSSRLMRATLDSSNEVTSVDYFYSGVSNVIDVATGPDGALYCAGFNNEGHLYGPFGPLGPLYRLIHTNRSQRIIVSPKSFFMAEGGMSLCNVSLASAPAADVTVTVSRDSGASISTTNEMLTFTPGNYARPQPIYFRADADTDPYSSRATFLLSAPGLETQEVKIRAFDRDGGVFRFVSVSRSSAVTRMELAAEPNVFVGLESSTDLRNWRSVTNATFAEESITFLHTNSASQQFYRALPK